MWTVRNNTPFSADGYFTRNREGKEFWCVALRGRFRVRADGMTDLVEPLPIRLSPHYRDANAKELLSDSDFAPFRPAADILFHGSAVSPDEKAVDHIDINVSLGSLGKRAKVTGEQRLIKKRQGWAHVEKSSIRRVELSWTNSLGGLDPFVDDADVACEANPIGKGWSHHFERAPEGVEINAPQIIAPNEVFEPARTLPEPIVLICAEN